MELCLAGCSAFGVLLMAPWGRWLARASGCARQLPAGAAWFIACSVLLLRSGRLSRQPACRVVLAGLAELPPHTLHMCCVAHTELCNAQGRAVLIAVFNKDVSEAACFVISISHLMEM